MRVVPANIRWCRPEPARNGTRKGTGCGIAQPVTDVGYRKIAFDKEFETGGFANGVLYLVEIGAKLGEPPLETSFRQVEIGRDLSE